MAERTFEVTLPEGAQLSDASVAGPGGMPVTTSPEPAGKKNRYAFVYPVRPGKSQFQVVYKLPYGGAYDFVITPEAQIGELGVLLPKSMRFSSTSVPFAQDSDEAGMNVFFAKNVSTGQQVKFSISGEGAALAESQPNGGGSNPGAAGTPANAAEQTSPARWYIFGAILVIVAGGVFWMVQKRAPNSSRSSSSSAAKPQRQQRNASRSPQPMPEENAMLDALKDELFQLETDRLNGKISQQDYEATKAGLDALLRRQMNPRKSGEAGKA
jgi:hypothetical protein